MKQSPSLRVYASSPSPHCMRNVSTTRSPAGKSCSLVPARAAFGDWIDCNCRRNAASCVYGWEEVESQTLEHGCCLAGKQPANSTSMSPAIEKYKNVHQRIQANKGVTVATFTTTLAKSMQTLSKVLHSRENPASGCFRHIARRFACLTPRITELPQAAHHAAVRHANLNLHTKSQGLLALCAYCTPTGQVRIETR